jgi:hypothetical protein
LFYRKEDIGSQSFKTGEGRIEDEVLERVAKRIASVGRLAKDTLTKSDATNVRIGTHVLYRTAPFAVRAFRCAVQIADSLA